MNRLRADRELLGTVACVLWFLIVLALAGYDIARRLGGWS